MTDEPPLVSVVIPARQEADDLPRCLDAVLRQTWPRSAMEVLVVDGGSTDDTAAVARSILATSDVARWEVVANASGTTPSNLNCGLAAARGAFVCRVDARSVLPEEYVRTCVAVLQGRPDVAVVGGGQRATPRPGSGPVARGIARALRNPYVTGFSRYRRGGPSGPSDTVYLGFFRTADLREVGGWDERFRSNQDFELNRRLGRTRLVWFESGLVVDYLPRATLRALAAQYRRFGRWKAAAWLEGDVPISPRQVGLLAAPPIAGVGALWLLWPRPAVGAAGLVVGAVALDLATREAGPPRERAAGVLAATLIVGGWWAGTVEQAVRYLAGQRLLSE